MKLLTLDQLRALVEGGGVETVTLVGTGKNFTIRAKMSKGGDAILVTTNGKEVREFADPRRALTLLRDMGIRKVAIDADRWEPGQPSVPG